MSFWAKYREISLFKKIFVAMILGIIAGIIFKQDILVIKPLGKIFVNILKMAALPLIIVNLIAGISSMDDPKILGRVGGKIMVYYTLTTVLALIVGLGVTALLKPGVGFVLQGEYSTAIAKVPSLGDTIISLLPSNIFAALAEGRFDQIIIFALFVGIAILLLPKNQRTYLSNHFEMLASLFRRLVWIVMGYAPIGVFALMATTVGTYGQMLAGFVVKYVTATYISIFVMFGTYTVLLMIFSKMTPGRFYKSAGPVMVTTLSTSSSLATVPVTLSAADDLGVPRSVSSFTVPLGAQINKDGNGIMLAISFLAVAQAVGAPLSMGILMKALFLGLILTTGSGGVPGGGIVTIAIIVDAFGLPLEMIGIIAGIFGIIDVGLTTSNCVGDLVGTAIVGLSEEQKAFASAD